MRLIRLWIVMLILAMVPLMVHANEPVDSSVSTITVQGSGYVEAVPDEAVVDISVTASAPTAAEAQNTNAKIVGNIQHKLQSAGIAADKIRTLQYTVFPVYNYEEKTRPAPLVGYSANNTMRVILDDVSSTGTIIDTALSAGATQISGVRFQKRAEIELKQTALQKAVKDASAKAEAIAAALGKHLAKVVSVNEGDVSVQAPEFQRSMLMNNSRTADAGGGYNTPIAAGDIKINATVTIVYEMQ